MERSPKRQRLNDPYSPASPPPPSSDTKHGFVPPQTPPPSERMSPSWQAQSNPIHQQPTSGSNFPTPPSTAGYQGHIAGRAGGSEAGGESERQTPATEDDSEVRRDSDGDAEMTDRQDRTAKDVAMVDAEHRRTDHERKKGAQDLSISSIPGAQPIYKLSTSQIAPARPHPSQNFIELYGLQKIQQSVARRDPVTGEKINKLRKSYENKVKNLKLDGRNKAQANQGELIGLLDPLWNNDAGNGHTWWTAKWYSDDNKGENEGKRLGEAASHEDLFSKLDKAFDMCPGRLPPKEHREWDNMLGLDDAGAAAGGRTPGGGAVKPQPAAALAAHTPGAVPGRPDRAGKKRRYNDSSFEGYEGYDEDGSSVKRPKHKDFTASSRNSPSLASGNGSGGSMVGVTSS